MFSKYIDKKNIYAAEIDDDSLLVIKEQGYNCFKPELSKPVLPYNNDFFDYIFISNVMEHIPNKFYKEYLREFHRVLKPHGIILFGAPNYPFKRIYDIKKAFKSKQYRYYLLDDPTHCNKLSILRYEKDFGAFFNEVRFEPTEIFFENNMDIIKRNRYRLRFFGDKI
ncbi:MAG TPA: class I SAM-dependent methyltransferase, partial [Spirochaetota bacterium]|nr:class I SAM-dependent methyltransferase [Spirochaetota bacterium]